MGPRNPWSAYQTIGACVLGLALATPASAQDRSKASFRFEEGKAALAKGRIDDAIAALGEAHPVLKTPSSGLAYAQALEKKGRIVEALTVANEARGFPKGPKETFGTIKARSDLDALAKTLESRVARLKIEAPAGATITIDDKEAKLVDGAVRVDPGAHKVVATTAAGPITVEVTAAAGEEKAVKLEPEAGAPKAAPAGPPTSTAPAPTDDEPPASKPTTTNESSSGPTGAVAGALVGFTAFAFGAGLGLGTFFVSKNKLDDLEASCPNGTCPSWAQAEYDDASTTRTISFVGFGIAGAGLITGIVGAAVAGASSGAKSGSSEIRFAVGPTSVVVQGSF